MIKIYSSHLVRFSGILTNTGISTPCPCQRGIGKINWNSYAISIYFNEDSEKNKESKTRKYM